MEKFRKHFHKNISPQHSCCPGPAVCGVRKTIHNPPGQRNTCHSCNQQGSRFQTPVFSFLHKKYSHRRHTDTRSPDIGKSRLIISSRKCSKKGEIKPFAVKDRHVPFCAHSGVPHHHFYNRHQYKC